MIWNSNTNGRSFFGWVIKEEIFAVFFILVIIQLFQEKNIQDLIKNDNNIQIFAVLLGVFCVYHKIPLSLLFTIVFIIAFYCIYKNSTVEYIKNKFSTFFEKKEKKGKKVRFKKPICEEVSKRIYNIIGNLETCKDVNSMEDVCTDIEEVGVRDIGVRDMDTDLDTDVDTDIDDESEQLSSFMKDKISR